LEDAGIWYRVFAGYFKTMQEAEEKIERLNLKNALVKKTRFATLIGTYSSEDETNSKIRSLMETEYSPYTVLGKTGDFRLYLGAFYTKEGAETQCLELISKGISCEIVER
jgi:cell division protein FtsN